MLRGMIFMDHLNFDINLRRYYSNIGKQAPKLDYNKLFKEIAATVPNIDFTKAFIFVPKPDEFLMQDKNLEKYYNWAVGLKNAPFTDVIEGSYVARPVDESVPMDISKRNTYYKVEKGTDVNLAIHAVNKAFYNSFDVGFFLSADTDYITVYNVLKSLGKLAVLVSIKEQNIRKLIPHVDKYIVLDDQFFNKCLRN